MIIIIVIIILNENIMYYENDVKLGIEKPLSLHPQPPFLILNPLSPSNLYVSNLSQISSRPVVDKDLNMYI